MALYTRGDVYFDNNSTTKVHPSVLQIFSTIAEQFYANPSTSYKPGKEARSMINESRSLVADLLGASPRQLFFCSSATEANIILLRGFAAHAGSCKTKLPHIISTKIEHPSVYRTLLDLRKHKLCTVSWVGVDSKGFVDVKELHTHLQKHPHTVLVSVIVAHNEFGTIQDVRAITSLCRQFNVPVHGDITQMVGKYEINLRRDGLFSAAFSGHKFHGIRGCGGLFLRDPSRIDTCMTGGSQENNVRASTECTALICSMAYALYLALEDLPQKQQRVRRMRDYIQSEIVAMFPPGLVVVNCDTDDVSKRLYNTLSISIPCCKNTKVMDELNKRGIYLNIGSACNKDKQSRNLSAIGLSEQQIQGTFRISLSSMNTMEECKYFVSAMHTMRPWFTLQQRKPRSDNSLLATAVAAA